MQIQLDYLPVSVNVCYRTYKGKIYKSKRLREFHKKLKADLQGFDKVEGKVSIDIQFQLKSKRKRDIDNMLKALIDGLEHIVIENDYNVYRLSASKQYGESDKTVIKISKFDIDN